MKQHISKEINLLTKHEDLSPVELKKRKLVKRWVTYILIFYLIILFGLFGYLYYLKKNLFETESNIKNVSYEIRNLVENEGIYMLLKQKVVSLKKILDNRYPYHKVITFFMDFEGDTVDITSIDFLKENQVTLVVKLKSVDSIDSFLKQLLEKGTQQLKKIEIQSVNYDLGGVYQINLQIIPGKLAIL